MPYQPYEIPKFTMPPTISSREEAQAYAEEMVVKVEIARNECGVPVDSTDPNSGRELRRREMGFLMKYGAALGTLSTLLRCRHLDAIAYNTFIDRVQKTMLATVSGKVSRV